MWLITYIFFIIVLLSFRTGWQETRLSSILFTATVISRLLSYMLNWLSLDALPIAIENLTVSATLLGGIIVNTLLLLLLLLHHHRLCGALLIWKFKHLGSSFLFWIHRWVNFHVVQPLYNIITTRDCRFRRPRIEIGLVLLVAHTLSKRHLTVLVALIQGVIAKLSLWSLWNEVNFLLNFTYLLLRVKYQFLLELV